MEIHCDYRQGRYWTHYCSPTSDRQTLYITVTDLP